MMSASLAAKTTLGSKSAFRKVSLNEVSGVTLKAYVTRGSFAKRLMVRFLKSFFIACSSGAMIALNQW